MVARRPRDTGEGFCIWYESLTSGAFEAPTGCCFDLEGKDPVQELGEDTGTQDFVSPAAVSREVTFIIPLYWRLPAGLDLSWSWGWGLLTSTPSPSSVSDPSVEKRKLRAELGAARNSIWCLSVSALSQRPGPGDAAPGPARKCQPSSARREGGLGGQETRSSSVGVSRERGGWDPDWLVWSLVLEPGENSPAKIWA